jgi:hypothetical protein
MLMDDSSFIANEYQVGDEWGKKPVTREEFNNQPQLTHIAYGTAHVSGGTGFYLGKFAGKHVMATNHHVCSGGFNCKAGSTVKFPLMGKSFTIEAFYGSWPEIDLALFAIKVNSGDEALMTQVDNPFDFRLPIKEGEPLATLGFGAAENPSRQLVGNWDDDCKVFSADNDYRLLADPDSVNPGPYKTWSFVVGCDVSHGDSGSAMVDRASGHVIGIIWTGKIPKDPRVQSSAYLDELLAKKSPEIWSELSFAVPSVKIQEKLRKVLAGEKPNVPFALVLNSMINN